MFTRREVFTESFLPRDLPGRKRERDRLEEILAPATRGEPARSCWELGPSGVGKTTTARWMLKQLRSNHLVDWTLVECVGSTRWQMLGDICGDHPQVPHHAGMGVSQMLTELEETVDDPYVVVLDEFDGLEDEQLLVDLYGLEMVSVICIGHDQEDAFATVPDRADGLIHAETIEFEPYSVTALLDILEARVETGLEEGVVDADQLHRIADAAGGSARKAVQSLRSAVELGEERGHTEVTEADVDDCFEHAMERIREQLLNSLARDHHIVYSIIHEASPQGVTPPEILERYHERSGKSRTRQQVRNYREKLQRYELVESEGSTRWDRWTVVDETLEAPLRKPA